MGCGRVGALCHYIFALEDLGRDAQAETLKEDGDVSFDIGADPEFLVSERDGDGADVGQLAEDDDGGKLPSGDDVVANGATIVAIVGASQGAHDVSLAE